MLFTNQKDLRVSKAIRSERFNRTNPIKDQNLSLRDQTRW